MEKMISEGIVSPIGLDPNVNPILDSPIGSYDDIFGYSGIESPPLFDNNLLLFDNSIELFDNSDFSNTTKGEDIVNTARTQLNTPYVYAQATPGKGFDCSGLIQWAYKENGISLPRTSLQMAKLGKRVNLDEVQPGDIVFTHSSQSPSGGHVRMISKIENGQIYVVEAASRKTGIVERPLKQTSGLNIRRVLGSEDELPKSGIFTNKNNFIVTMNNTFRKELSKQGLDPNYSYILTSSAAMESGWGTKLSGKFNYGGVTAVGDKPNKRKYRNFDSISDYCKYIITLLQNKRYNAFNSYSSTQPYQFWNHVLSKGYEVFKSTNDQEKYMNSIRKIYSSIKTTLT